MKFSHRKGYKAVRNKIQKEEISPELRNTLWNALDLFIWSSENFIDSPAYTAPGIDQFSKLMWLGYFKEPIDTRPDNPWAIHKRIREYFFSCQWYEVYDFLEWVLSVRDDSRLVQAINTVLEQELSGFRYVDGHFTDITDPEEVDMLAGALTDDDFPPVRAHLHRALELLSDRNNPDYRNSIKESISAVEAMARELTRDKKVTLGDALKTLGSAGAIHPALRDGFLKLYGYTSDEGGIRHAMLEHPNPGAAEARYFLLSCTSFINYLKSRFPSNDQIRGAG